MEPQSALPPSVISGVRFRGSGGGIRDSGFRFLRVSGIGSFGYIIGLKGAGDIERAAADRERESARAREEERDNEREREIHREKGIEKERASPPIGPSAGGERKREKARGRNRERKRERPRAPPPRSARVTGKIRGERAPHAVPRAVI